MRRLVTFSVRYPTTVLMLVLAILLMGLLSFERLGMDLFPDLQNPRLFIEVVSDDRPPEEMERQLVTALESAAARGRGVERVSSVTQTGRALITVEYSWGRVDMDEAFLDLQKRMADRAQRADLGEVTVSQHDPNAVPIVVAAFYHSEVDDLDVLRRTAESVIRTELIRLPGVAAVELVGERRREVEILADAYTLEAYGLTVENLRSAIENANVNMSGGTIVEMGRRYIIKGVGELTSVEDLQDLIVTTKTPETALRTGSQAEAAQGSDVAATAEQIPVTLREVAEVRSTLSTPENTVRLDGRRCIGLEIYKEARFNTIDAAQSVHLQLDQLRRALPGYEIEVVQDQARFIEAAVTEVEETGLIGVLLAVVVLFLFLRRIGVTAVVSMAIPISVVATFNLMFFADLTLNLMTLGGLALGAGMLVDNAIVVVENVFRKLEGGASLADAAIEGATEVGGAITSSTLTTIVVFLPIVYLHGAAGELFREQAWTVAFALLSSLFVAVVVIPMLCSRLLSADRAARDDAVHFPRYANLLAGLLNQRFLVLAVGLGLVGAMVLFLPRLGSEFMPRTGSGELELELSLPVDTPLERTEGTVRNLEAFLLQNFADHLRHVYARVGAATTSGREQLALADESSAVIHMLIEPSSKLTPDDLIAALGPELAGLPQIKAQFVQQETALEVSLGRTSAPLLIEIKGKELARLTELGERVHARLAAMPELTNVEITGGEKRPQIDVEIDRTRAAQHGIDLASVATQLEHLLSGRQAGQLQERGEQTDITIRRPAMSLRELGNAMLEGPDGGRVRLDEVARLVSSQSPRSITRSDQTRTATVSAELNSERPFDQVVIQVETALAALDWPPEYGFEVTGEERLRQDAFNSLRFALLLAVLMVYMVMAAQFESLVHPFVILLTIPLAGVGAVAVLMALGMPLNVMSFIGIIMLVGIAVNDSIILVDRINQNRRVGQELTQAIIGAGQSRIRPIVMTSVTTMLALLPLAAGAGEGASLRAPMAVAVIGGLVTSTALTLIVIPCAYHVLARIDRLRPSAA